MSDLSNRRRSTRLLIAIPIRVQGTSVQGRALNETTRTLEINLHGAKILLKGEVNPGTILQIANIARNSTAPFRALRLERQSPQEGEAKEWAVECLDDKRNIWGVEFPS